jgi:pilus assembly protein CpaB
MLKSRTWIIIAGLLGVLAAVLVNNYLVALRAANVEDVPMAIQVVAKGKIAVGTKLGAELLETIRVPEELAHPSAATDPKEVIGKFTVTDLWPGEVILAGRVADEKTSSELPFKIPEGLRAVTVAVGAVSGVGGHLKPGHYVDLLSFWTPDDDSGIQDMEVATIIQNALVLAVGTDLQKKDAVQVVDNVTLALSPDDAQKVFLTENVGKLKLIARPIGESGTQSIPTLDLSDLRRLHP